ncbi:hypothetical protein HanIR_Chr09g0425731 [Helianthus annuus]|nr:hypothetical protein HanIR_Chr09g0425731 [Helianthus annuus]
MCVGGGGGFRFLVVVIGHLSLYKSFLHFLQLGSFVFDPNPRYHYIFINVRNGSLTIFITFCTTHLVKT